jgi:hypothetical protein
VSEKKSQASATTQKNAAVSLAEVKQRSKNFKAWSRERETSNLDYVNIDEDYTRKYPKNGRTAREAGTCKERVKNRENDTLSNFCGVDWARRIRGTIIED